MDGEELRRPVPFQFTELLYGVVIGLAISRITSLSLTREYLLLGLVLVLAFEDYLVFHVEVQRISDNGRNFVTLFILDLITLCSWYGLTLSTRYSPRVFFSALTVYFLATTVWGWRFSARTGPWLKGDIPVALTTAFNILVVTRWASAERGAMLLFLLVYIVWRLPVWREIWRMEESVDPQG